MELNKKKKEVKAEKKFKTNDGPKLFLDMIHELIDPKKRSNKTSASRNVKTLQENRTIIENRNFEANDCENKEAESSSVTFIPPWLRNSLGLNQRNNLSHATASSDVKCAKISQRDKELDQNEFDSLKTNVEENYCKKTNHFTAVPQDIAPEDKPIEDADNIEAFNSKNDGEISIYWDIRHKDSETGSSCTNVETKSLTKEDLKISNTYVMTSAEVTQLKEEEKKKLRVMKQKNKLKKRNTEDQKPIDIKENSIDFLLKMKAKKDNIMKSDITPEMRNHFQAKLTLLNSKSLNLSKTKLNQQELRLLQKIKKHVGNPEEVEKLFDHVKEINVRDIIKDSDFLSKNMTEKKVEEKEEKSAKEAIQNYNDERKSNEDKDSLLSTDDENDIKRFSEFLSKNKNLDEKRKCLEEVRNYFERKRRLRMSKRRFLEDEKSKLSLAPDAKEENFKKKLKFKEFYRGRKSKFALCDEEIVEKAVDETLQKFVEMYHIHVTPVIMGNMKKNILQAITSEPDNPTKLTESSSAKKANAELLNTSGKEKELEKDEMSFFPESESIDVSNKESTIHKEIKKKNFKTLIESTVEQVSKSMKEVNFVGNEQLKRLKKEFDNFLCSMQNNTDVTNLKLQSIILEKEEPTVSSKSSRFVYNFTKKALEPERTDHQMFKESLESKNYKDSETQTAPETELIRRNVKVQAFEQKNSCEENLQTENIFCIEESTQTNDEQVKFREIKELTDYDVNPGLYRMVKSKEAGKFYLYPEQRPYSKEEVCENCNSSNVIGKKNNKKKELLNLLVKERAKERRIFFREKERKKLKESKKADYEFKQNEQVLSKKENSSIKSENSVNCLYFRDFEEKNSESLSSKKESDLIGQNLTDENISGRLNNSEELGLGDAKQETPKENHLGHFWFWDGEKITPGCDLKTHVEDLLKEKLKEITSIESRQNELTANSFNSSNNKNKQINICQRNFDSRNTNTLFCFNSVQDNTKGNALVFTENECIKEINKIERKNNEDEETGKSPLPIFEEKSVRDVATQNSQQTFLSLNVSKFRIQSKISSPIKKKFNKRNIYIKPAKTMNLKRAEDIIRAFEELKKIQLGLENTKKENSPDSESIIHNDTSTSRSVDEAEDRLSVFDIKNGPAGEEISSSDFRNKFKKFISFVDQEIQTSDTCELKNGSYVENKMVNNHKHLELIESLLSKVNHRKREDLWNDVRHFIKAKIGRDINCEGAREVCIEIEQDIPKNEQGKPKHPVLAKGHYSRNEGDVEVEIDLTLDDLERILRQRQKKIRRRALYRSSKSKKFSSSSSTQSDFTKDDFHRYQKYLHRFATLRRSFIENQNMKAFLEK